MRLRRIAVLLLLVVFLASCGQEEAPSKEVGVLSGFEHSSQAVSKEAATKDPTMEFDDTESESISESKEDGDGQESVSYEAVHGRMLASELELGAVYYAERDVVIENDFGVPLCISASHWNFETGKTEAEGALIASCTLTGGRDEVLIITGRSFAITAPESVDSTAVFGFIKVARLSEASPGTDLEWVFMGADYLYNDTGRDVSLVILTDGKETELEVPDKALVKRSGESVDGCSYK